MNTRALTIDERRTHVGMSAWLRVDRGMTLALFCVGAALCFPYLYTSFGLLPIVLLSLTWCLSSVAARHARRRRLRWSALAFSTALYAVSAYGAVVFTAVLGWSLPRWALVSITVATLAAGLTSLRGWPGLRVPVVLPLGLLIAAVLSGWWREGGRVRCDDYLQVSRQSDVTVIVPSVRELADCRAGAMLPLRRYPRQIWESQDQQTIVFTTQAEPYPGETANGLDGAVCAVRLGGDAAPQCSGVGKGDGIVEMGSHGRLIAVSSGGEHNGSLYTFSLDRLFAESILTSVHRAGSAIFDPVLDTLYVLGDDGRMIIPMRGADMRASGEVAVPLPMLADYGRYDAGTHEGILCGAAGPIGAFANGGHPYLAVGFHGAPLALRPFGDSMLGWLAFSFGCDWDPATRRAYVAIPNLGAVAELDYDSGRVVDFGRADVGLRYLRFDPSRRRLYATNFLRGSVVELDADDKRELRRWFVGRFARDVRATRDGRALLAASNLGVVRISL